MPECGHPRGMVGGSITGVWNAFWRVVAITLLLLGLSGLPGDLDTWVRWIEMAAADPRVVAVAEIAVAIANVVNHPVSRLCLFAGGLVMISWNWPLVARARASIGREWRHAVGSVTWISDADAIETIARSDWAQSRKPSKTIIQNNSLLSGLYNQTRAMSPDKEEVMLHHFSKMTLFTIERENPAVKRKTDGGEEFHKELIENWLDRAFDQEVTREFGKIPTIKMD